MCGRALEALPNIGGNVSVEGSPGGPYEVRFLGTKVGLDLPQLTADASGLILSGAVTAATLENGFSYDTRYHFEYVSQEDFEREGGFASPHTQSTPEGDAGAGMRENDGTFASAVVAADLSGLRPGVTYRYRLVATNTTTGDPIVRGEEQTLAVPAAPAASSEACPNEQFRTGLSAHLPDCRAYEQVTPLEKGGSPEAARYGFSYITPFFVGEDGDHFLLESQVVKWGSKPGSNESAYLFSRKPADGWGMISATPQPEGGVNYYTPALHSPDLAQAGVEVGWTTVSNSSPDVSLAAGPLGGPYAPVASMPRSDVPGGGNGDSAWVAASADFSKLVFWSEDHKLLGGNSGTASGADLYEYSAGQVHQLNVDSAGETIGSCGAKLVQGYEGYTGGSRQRASSHAVSVDGSRVFFEAVPASNCDAPSHLYMRTDGESTLDLGPYRFVAANPQGSEVLLSSGGETFLEDTAGGTIKHLFNGLSLSETGGAVVSENLTAVYFRSRETLLAGAPNAAEASVDIYRYDVAGEKLSFVAQTQAATNYGFDFSTTPDGRELYFLSQGVAGVPGGRGFSEQVYRYDSSEATVQCMSCASTSDPEPRLSSSFATVGLETGTARAPNGVPGVTISSADGDYVFFDALSTLLPADVDGEETFEEATEINPSHSLGFYSPSSDVYEWRREGIGGCAHAQGCLSLISSGQGGHLVMLLGTTSSGHDVFFTTNSQLVRQDKDTASDVYDARVGGGFSEAVSPVECEGDACSTPLPAPNDLTPSSATFNGAGNIEQPSLIKPTVKSVTKPKPKKAKKHKVKAKKAKRRKTKGKKAKTSNRRRGK